MDRTRPIRDATFPGLATALDPAAMRELLAETLPECRDGLAVEDVRIFQVQYRPRKQCSILYSVKFRPEGGRSQDQLLAAELLPAGARPAPPDALRVERYRRSGERPLRSPAVVIPAAGLVAHAFPFDPRLPDLVNACDEQHMKEKLGRMWKARGVRLRQVSVRPLGFTPGARAALLFETLAECRDTGLPEVRRLVGKIDVQREASELFARNWSVWKETQLRFRLPPPVGCMADPDLFLQEQVDGERLSDLAGTGDFVGPVRQTARAVALLHEMPLPLRFRRASLQSVKAVRRWTKTLAAIRPDQRDRIRALGDRLTAELENRAAVTGPIHADLHPSNLLVSDGQVVLIDFDNMVLGDRLLDVGRFMSALRTSALRVAGRPDALADAGESFLERYLSCTGEDERRARLFEAAALLISAGTGFRLQRDGWEETTGWLLDECERTLGLACGTSTRPPGRPSAESMKRRDAAAEARRGVDRLSWGLDTLYVRGLLAPHVRRVYDAELTECATEAKGLKQRREHVRYRLGGWRGDERWKGVLDGFFWVGKSGRSQHERHVALWEAVEGRDAAPRLPRPVAFLRELGLQVVELPRGKSLGEVLDDDRAPAALERVGRALAAIHHAPLDLDKVRGATGEWNDLRAAAEPLATTAPETHATVAELLDRLEPLVLDDAARTAPTVRHLSPRRVLIANGHVALGDVDDIVAAHPYWDAGAFLARCAASAPTRGDTDRAARLGDAFRRGYLGAGGADAGIFAAFEAAALVRAFCNAATRADDGTAAARPARPLLDAAVARVTSTVTGDAR